MGRAGAGGRSGGHSTSHHSSMRSSSHHSMSSSRPSSSRPSSGGHRAGSTFGSNHSSIGNTSRPNTRPSGRVNTGFGNPTPMTPPRRDKTVIVTPPPMPRRQTVIVTPSSPPPRKPPNSYSSGGYYESHHDTYQQNRRQRPLMPLIITIIVAIVLVAVIMSAIGAAGGVPKSTSNREKVNTGVAFQNDCIVDELGWFDNIPNTEHRLQSFYNQTGIQPYIVLKDYDASLNTSEKQDAYAEQWYDDHIDNEGALLFMYFAAEDTDNDVGEMTCINGKQITSVMDAEALDIFWAYMDNNWYSDASTDDMFVNVFNSTAKRIMTKSTTTMDVMKVVVILIVIVSAGGMIIYMIRLKFKRDKEKAAETERILNTPLSSSDDDLIDKYTE